MNSQYIRDNIIIEETRNEKSQFQLVAKINVGFVHTLKDWSSPPEDLKIKAEMDLKSNIVNFFFQEISIDVQQLRIQATDVYKLLDTVNYVEMNKLMVMFDQVLRKLK
jgi:hypothetical protein